MKTKLLLGLFALALCCTLSCERAASPATWPENGWNGPTGRVNIHLVFPEEGTKAPLSGCRENRIGSLQLFLFDKESGQREVDRYVTLEQAQDNSYDFTLTSLTGNKTVWAIVNAPRITDVGTADQLAAHVSDLADNRTDQLVMCGLSQDVTVAETSPNDPAKSSVVTEVNIPVSHLGVRISLESVCVDFRGTALEGAQFELRSLYLKNVVGKQRLDGSSPGTALNQLASWYNLGQKSAVEQAPAAIKALTLDQGLHLSCDTQGTAREVGYAWYAYPNATTAAQDHKEGEELPRMTRLVLQAHLGGTAVSGALDRDCYYVFTLPPLQRNRIYQINQITITLEGKPDDNSDDTTDSGKLDATIQVMDWDGTTPLEYES